MLREFACLNAHITEKILSHKADVETKVIPCPVCGKEAERATVPSRLGYRRDHTVLAK